jgi:HAD superfamily hydrolase (TIGR01662 family)
MQPVFFGNEKKVLFFDLHDTLVDRQSSFLTALENDLLDFTARWDSTEWSPEQAVRLYAKEWQKMTTLEGRQHHHTKRSPKISFEQKQLQCVRKALQGAPLERSDAFLRSLLKRVCSASPRYSRTFPHVRDTLEQLHPKYKLAIISNGSQERLRTTLSSAGLNHLFLPEHIFVPLNRSKKKPHPDLFHRALQRLNADPSEAVMIGNSWRNDIFGANRCGIDAIWIQPSNKKILQRRIGKNKVCFISRCKQLLSLLE